MTAFRPLAGVRVVDVTTSLAGPYCTEVLGAFGADVVKIEPPEAATRRARGARRSTRARPRCSSTANANKRSVAVELRRGSEIVRRLAETCRRLRREPQAGARRGARALRPPTLRARNDRLIYASISGFGTEGPLATRPGYDPLAQAAAGILSVTGEADRDPVRVGVSLVDQTTGVWSALSILAALRQRDADGSGRDDRALAVRDRRLADGLPPRRVRRLGRRAGPARHRLPVDRPVRDLRRRRRPAHARGRERPRLRVLLRGRSGSRQLPGDPLYATNGERVRNRAALRALVAERLAGDTRERWLERFAEANVPAAPVQDAAEVLAHPQTGARLLQVLGGLPVARLPVAVDGERSGARLGGAAARPRY